MAVTIAEIVGHVAETTGHVAPKRAVTIRRNARSRSRNHRSRWAEIRTIGTATAGHRPPEQLHGHDRAGVRAGIDAARVKSPAFRRRIPADLHARIEAGCATARREGPRVCARGHRGTTASAVILPAADPAGGGRRQGTPRPRSALPRLELNAADVCAGRQRRAAPRMHPWRRAPDPTRPPRHWPAPPFPGRPRGGTGRRDRNRGR